jgi:hypothetical protein
MRPPHAKKRPDPLVKSIFSKLPVKTFYAGLHVGQQILSPNQVFALLRGVNPASVSWKQKIGYVPCEKAVRVQELALGVDP